MARPRGERQPNPAEAATPDATAPTGPESQQATQPQIDVVQPAAREVRAGVQRQGAETQATPPPSEPTPQERRRQGSNRDRDPFWRNRVTTETREETVPEEPSINLEREKNYSRNEEINHLIQWVKTGDWQRHEESQRLEQRYGRAGGLRRMKEWLGGERDFTYDEETGTMQYHWQTELARRAAHIGINTAETAGIMLAAGVLTGGVGAAFGGALLGSTLGRGFAQAWRGISGTERGMREDLEISRVRYYQKASELANRIGSEEPTEGLTPEEESHYYAERNDTIRDLVNFVNSSEQHGVARRLTGEENGERDTEKRRGLRSRITDFFRSSGGHPYVRGGAQGEPIEPEIGPGEPMGGGPSGPGTEVYQPSEVAPTRQTLDDMEKKFEQYRTRWEWIETGLALVGGLAGGAKAMLEAKKGIAQAATDRLARGEILRLDVDGVNGAHGVQRVTEGMRNMWNISSEYIFHYNSAVEAMKEGAANAQILPQGQFGAHVLEGVKTVGGAINKEALQQATKGVIGVFAGLFAHTAWRGATNERQHERHGREREGMKQEQEILRRRLQPETRVAQLKNEFFESNKPLPEQGQNWMWNGSRIVIKNVDDTNPDKVLLRVIRENPDLDYDEVMIISAESLLLDDAVCVIKREGGRREKKEELLNVNLDEDLDEDDDEEFEGETGVADTGGDGSGGSDAGGVDKSGGEGKEESGVGDDGVSADDLRKAKSGVPDGSYGGDQKVASETDKDKDLEKRIEEDLSPGSVWVLQNPDRKSIYGIIGDSNERKKLVFNPDNHYEIKYIGTGEGKSFFKVKFKENIEGSTQEFTLSIAEFTNLFRPDRFDEITDTEEREKYQSAFYKKVQQMITESRESQATDDSEGKEEKGEEADLAKRHRVEESGEEVEGVEGEDEESKLAAEYRLRLAEIYEKAGERTPEEVRELLTEVNTLLASERQAGQGKLRESLADIDSNEMFLDGNVVYLPGIGSVVFVGDTHGDPLAARAIIEQSRFIERLGGGEPIQMVFLGDYVDRGSGDLANIEEILDLKRKFPNNVVLLRGNHDMGDGISPYTFDESVKKKYEAEGTNLWHQYVDTTKSLPLAVASKNGIIALHGGIGDFSSLDDLNQPGSENDIVWNDPTTGGVSGFPTRGGAGRTFGEEDVDKFLEGSGGRVLLRGHEYPSKILFNGKLATIFSNGQGSEFSGYKRYPAYYLEMDLGSEAQPVREGQMTQINYSTASPENLGDKTAQAREVIQKSGGASKTEKAEGGKNPENIDSEGNYTSYKLKDPSNPDSESVTIEPGQVWLLKDNKGEALEMKIEYIRKSVAKPGELIIKFEGSDSQDVDTESNWFNAFRETELKVT